MEKVLSVVDVELDRREKWNSTVIEIERISEYDIAFHQHYIALITHTRLSNEIAQRRKLIHGRIQGKIDEITYQMVSLSN